MLINGAFYWIRDNGDGSAAVLPDTQAIRDEVDREGRRYYGTIEGAIINGSVKATAYERKTEQTYDAARWLKTGERVPAGFVTTTKITAERE